MVERIEREAALSSRVGQGTEIAETKNRGNRPGI